MERSLELTEYFHLAFLRHLSQRLLGREYAVKGGICLRFFHRSPRLSQDLDLDIHPQVMVHTLRRAVDSILEARAFLASLASYGVLGLGVSRPKQTETTQRWKLALRLGPNTALSTKIEFSRRKAKIPYARGIPDAELLNHFKASPFATQYYDAVQMTAQKISALTSPTRHAARDLFDLHHLIYTVKANLEAIHTSVGLEAIHEAAYEVEKFSYRDFKEQVLPFLPETLILHYSESHAFEQLKLEVKQALTQIKP